MTISARLTLPFARPYAARAGSEAEDPGLDGRLLLRLASMSWWARAAAAGCSLFARWLAPAVFLGVLGRFESLDGERQDLVLEHLQRCRPLALRGSFLLLKSLVLPASYAAAGYLEMIDFKFAQKP